MTHSTFLVSDKISSGKENNANIWGLAVHVAKLETDVHYIRGDIAEIKTDIRKFDSNLRQLEYKVDAKIERLEHKVDANLKWMLSVFGGGFVTLSGLMIYGFNFLISKL